MDDNSVNSLIAAVLANTRADGDAILRCNVTDARAAVRKVLDRIKDQSHGG